MDKYKVEKGQGLTEGVETWDIVYYDEFDDAMPVLVATAYTKWDADQIADLLNEDEAA